MYFCCKTKSAFTRAYNKEGPLLPFAPVSGISKKRAAFVDSSLLDDDEDTEDTDTSGNGITCDTMIKVIGFNIKILSAVIIFLG